MKKIYIIDDSIVILKGMSIYLAKHNYDVKTLRISADFSADEINLYCPDLIIIDINMPDVDGFEILERIKNLHICPTAKKMMCSTKFFDQDINKSKALGADDFLSKPFTENVLIEKIEKIIGKSL